MLATQTADHDTTGQWMSHHLAELIVAAEDDATTTVEQRLEIVDTILRVWAHRRSFPRPAPLEDFSRIFSALDRLGDETPWRFLRLFEMDAEPPNPTASGHQLAETAADLERLARETVLHLLWRAAQSATESNQEWLDVAQRIQSDVETDVTDALSRHRRSVALRRLAASTAGPPDSAEPHAVASTEQPVDEDEGSHESPFSDVSHARLLRDMARLLETIADDLTASGTDDGDPDLSGG